MIHIPNRRLRSLETQQLAVLRAMAEREATAGSEEPNGI